MARWRTASKRPELPKLHRLDLQGQIFRVDAALGQTTGDEPQPLLRRALEHAVEFTIRADAPDRADALRHLLAERTADELDLRIVAGRQNNDIGRNRRAILQQRAIGDEALDPVILQKAQFPLDHQIRAARVEIVATTAAEILHLVAGLVLADIVPEADALEAFDHVLIKREHALRDGLVALDDQRRRRRRDDQVAVLQWSSLVPDRFVEPGTRVDRYDSRRAPLDQRRVHAMAVQIQRDIVCRLLLE